jgi:hypothetical protein
MAASMRLVHRMRRHFRRERVFRDRSNPLDMYNDDELFRRFRLPRRELLELIDTFAVDLEYVSEIYTILYHQYAYFPSNTRMSRARESNTYQ